MGQSIQADTTANTQATYRNWAYAGINLLVWHTIAVGHTPIPVAAFDASLDEDPVYIGIRMVLPIPGSYGTRRQSLRYCPHRPIPQGRSGSRIAVAVYPSSKPRPYSGNFGKYSGILWWSVCLL